MSSSMFEITAGVGELVFVPFVKLMLFSQKLVQREDLVIHDADDGALDVIMSKAMDVLFHDDSFLSPNDVDDSTRIRLLLKLA